MIAVWIVIGMVLAAVAIIWLYRRKKKSAVLSMDEMEGHDFECYCAELLEDVGFTDVELMKASGDFGADILAQKEGVTYAVQCKCYESTVGVHAVEEVYAGKAFYDRMVGAVMTNQYFTKPAKECAQKLKILLWDRDVVMAWEEDRRSR